MTRSALAIAAFIALLVLTAGCSARLAPASVSQAPPVDTECISGMAFVNSYTSVASQYDPKLDGDRQQLAATHSLATARGLLGDMATTLVAYDAQLRGLHPTSDFSDQFDSLLMADQHLHDGALELAASTFSVGDQSTFSAVATERQSALHDFRLEVEFVTSECA